MSISCAGDLPSQPLEGHGARDPALQPRLGVPTDEGHGHLRCGALRLHGAARQGAPAEKSSFALPHRRLGCLGAAHAAWGAALAAAAGTAVRPGAAGGCGAGLRKRGAHLGVDAELRRGLVPPEPAEHGPVGGGARHAGAAR